MLGLVSSAVFLGSITTHADLDDRHPLGVSWVQVPDSILDRQPDQTRHEPGFWQDDMYFGPESGARAFVGGRQPVLPGTSYEPLVGILFVQMDGVTLDRICGTGESANAAANCTPLVSNEVTFPAFGDDQAQAAVVQQLQVYYQDMNLVITDERPPDYVPYTMAVVGGTSSDAGQGNNVCGVANVACDGRKRNYVSLNFTNCGTQAVQMASIIAQETSHNWGLEHTNNPNDLLYPTAGGGVKSFVNECMDIDHSTGSGVTQCSYVHEYYCPGGEGEQQNSYGELLGVFGPREVDEIAPSIVSTSPADGEEFDEGANILITARTEENSRFLAVRWTWLEGLPSSVESYSGCTNNMCDIDLPSTVDLEPNEQAWDFVRVNPAPAGVYSFLLEVQDGYGNADSRTITFTVGDVSNDEGDDEDSGAGDESGDGVDDSGDETDDSTSGPGGQDSGGECNCRSEQPFRAAAWFPLVMLAGLRRRRAADSR